MSQNAQLPDQPIMKYVHPADRLRPWFGVAVGLVVLAGMLTFSILGRNFGTLDHLKLLNSAGVWLTMSLLEASAAILALLVASVALGERIERGVEGPHFISLIRLTARGGFATITPAVLFDVLKVTSTSLARGGLGGIRPCCGADSAPGNDGRSIRLHALVAVGYPEVDVRRDAGERPRGRERSGVAHRQPLLATPHARRVRARRS